MARFKFQLQVVLDHKQRLEDLAQLELSQAQAAQLREETALSELRQAEEDAVTTLEQQRFTGRLDIESLQLGMNYLEGLKVQIQRQQQVVERVQRVTESKREALMVRMQERKALERLKERQREAFLLEEGRREAREVDEMVVMRFVREKIANRRAAAQTHRVTAHG